MARTITDPTGRVWVVAEKGRHPYGFSTTSSDAREQESTAALVECTSGDERFLASITLAWRDLPDDELWARLDRARRRDQRGGTKTQGSGN